MPSTVLLLNNRLATLLFPISSRGQYKKYTSRQNRFAMSSPELCAFCNKKVCSVVLRNSNLSYRCSKWSVLLLTSLSSIQRMFNFTVRSDPPGAWTSTRMPSWRVDSHLAVLWKEQPVHPLLLLLPPRHQALLALLVSRPVNSEDSVRTRQASLPLRFPVCTTSLPTKPVLTLQPEEPEAFCGNCGSQREAGTAFCGDCGFKFDQAQ